MSTGSVTNLIARMKEGDPDALESIFHRYWPILVRLARSKFKRTRKSSVDEEDVAQNAFISFCNSLQKGKFPKLTNRNDLLAILIVITARKGATMLESERRKKRGGGKVLGESAINAGNRSNSNAGGIKNVPGTDPTPEEEALVKDLYRHCMESLPERLRKFAELYMGGLSYPEVAKAAGCCERTVQRKIPLILEKWREIARGFLED